MISLLFPFLLIFGTVDQGPSLDSSWHYNYEQALSEAARDQKSVLLVFSGSDWCKPCIRLQSEVFETEAFQSYAQDHWTLLKIDFPRKRKNKLSQEVLNYRNSIAAKYNPKGYFPFLLLLDQEGKVQRELSYKGGGFAAFKQAID